MKVTRESFKDCKGNVFQVTVLTVGGKRPGPVFTIVSGQHGMEHSGPCFLPELAEELDKEDISVKDYDHVGRQVPGNKSTDGKLSFRDTKLVFTEEQVKKETSRCLGCGASIVDPNKCIGCGLCTTRCEFDAIKLRRDNPDASTMRKAEEKLKYILPNGAKQALARPFVKKTPKETAWLDK